HLKLIFGSEQLPDTWNAIIHCIEHWMKSPGYQSHIESIAQEEKNHAVEVNEGTQIWVAYKEDQKAKVELTVSQKERKAIKTQQHMKKQALNLAHKEHQKEKQHLQFQKGMSFQNFNSIYTTFPIHFSNC
ncbi:hypothetical protein CROQUDRAFT_39846, partial [Cronartium quercuum f. sp. fusiforme G11]